MTKLTVFLVRHGETKEEIATAEKWRLHQRLDPALTETGFRQAQQVFLTLIQGICDQTPVPEDRGDSDDDGVIDPLRNMACFSAPLQACQSTAIMLSAAGLASQDKLTWRYTTIEAATSPSAVPVVTCNELCRQVPEIQRCGGVNVVVEAGILHTAAAPWNDARIKCPFMKVAVRNMKGTAQDFVKEWKADRNVDPPRRVLDCQYLRLETEDDPWSLQPLTPKVNLCVDKLEPKTYLTPPRQGRLTTKLNVDETVEELAMMPSTAVDGCVWKARQVGCDTVLLTVPAACLEDMLQQVTGGASSSLQIGPCSVVTLTATVDDGAGQVVDWDLFGTFTAQEIEDGAAAVPAFPGPVDCLVPPPPDKDPASVPANQWSKFPPPQPENIPPDYPDLPPFSLALRSPVPNVSPPPESAPRSPAGRGRAGRGRGRGPPSPGRGSRAPAPTGRTGDRTPATAARTGAGRIPTGRGAPNHHAAPGRGGQFPASRAAAGHEPTVTTAPTTPNPTASAGQAPSSPTQHSAPPSAAGPGAAVTPPSSPMRLPKQHTTKKPRVSVKTKKASVLK